MRVNTGAPLRDSWGIFDEVEIVDIAPPGLACAIKEGRIDATTRNSMSLTAEGPEVMAPRLLEMKGFHWTPVESATAEAINAANDNPVGIAN